MDAYSLFGELDAKTDKFEQSLRESEARLKATERAIHSTEKQATSLGQTTNVTARGFEKLREAVSQTQQRLQITADAFKRGEATSSQMRAALLNAENAAQKLNNRLRDSQARLADFANSSNKLTDVLNTLSGGFTQVGRVLTVAVTAPMVLASRAILRAGIDYEKALNIFQSVTKATADEMQRASTVSKQLGADVSLPATSAKDAALAMSELGKAGLTATQAMDAARGVLQLAAAGQLEEAQAAEIAANALNSFKLAASDAIRVADLLAAVSNASSAEVSDIANSLKQASATFAAAKIPIEDLTTAIGLMANAGVKGEDAGTSLKTFLSSIQAPTDKAASAIKSLGISIYDAAGNFRGMPTLIGEFQKALSGLSDEKQANIIKDIFGQDASRAARILFGEGEAGFNKMKAAITQVGAAADLARAKTLGVGGAWAAFKSQLETIGIDAFNAIKAPLTSLVQFVGGIVSQVSEKFSALPVGVQQAIVGIGVFVAALGPTLIAIGEIGVGIASLASGIAALGGLSAIAPIVAAVAAGIAGLALQGAVLYEAWKSNFGGIRDFVAQVTQRITQEWQNFMSFLNGADVTAYVDMMKQAFTDLQNTLKPAFDQISADFKSAFDEIIKWWDTNGQDIKNAAVRAFNALKTAVGAILSGISALWKEHGDNIKTIASAIWDTVKTVVGAGLKQIGNIIKLIAAVINGDWGKAWEALASIVKDSFNAVITVIKNFVIIIFNLIKSLAANFWNLTTAFANAGIALAKALVQGMVDGIKQGYNGIKEAAVGLANSAISAAKSTLGIQSPSKVFHKIGADVVQGFIDGINSLKAAGLHATAALLDFSGLKGHKAGIEIATQLANEIARLGVVLKEQNLMLDLEAGKYGKLSAEAKQRILLAGREIDTYNQLQDVLKGLGAIKVPTVLEKIEDLFASSSMTEMLQRQADAFKMTVEQLKEYLILLNRLQTSNKLETVLPDFQGGQPTRGTGEGGALDISLPEETFEQPPRLKKAWEDFFETFQTRVAEMKAGLPSLKLALGENLIASIDRIGDVFGRAVAEWDGTAAGFFKSIAQGFQQMVSAIIAEMVRLMVIKAITSIIGSFAGSGFGGGSSVGSFTGGFTGGFGGASFGNIGSPLGALGSGLGLGNRAFAGAPVSSDNRSTSNVYNINMPIHGVRDANSFRQSERQIKANMRRLLAEEVAKRG